jgi:hypothetical protein
MGPKAEVSGDSGKQGAHLGRRNCVICSSSTTSYQTRRTPYTGHSPEVNHREGKHKIVRTLEVLTLHESGDAARPLPTNRPTGLRHLTAEAGRPNAGCDACSRLPLSRDRGFRDHKHSWERDG